MKRFTSNLLVFVSLIFILSSLLAEISPSDQFIIYKTENTSYEKIAWNLKLIEEDQDRIRESIIFLGPSLMQGGVDDSLLSAHNYKALNLGVNHEGNEIELWFLNRIILFNPKAVYLHLSKKNHAYLHPMTPLLYLPSQLIKSGQSINIPFAIFFIKRVSYVVEYLFWSMDNIQKNGNNLPRYGIRYEEGCISKEDYRNIAKDKIEYLLESPNIHKHNFRLNSEKEHAGIKFNFKRALRCLKYYGKKINFLFNKSAQNNFVKKAFTLGKANNIPIAELYLPVLVDSKIKADFGKNFYSPRKGGNVISIKNFSFLDDSENWVDMNHLSKKGATLFTKQLVLEKTLELSP